MPSPDELLRGLKQRRTDEWHRLFRQSPHYREYVEERRSQHPPARGTGKAPRRPPFDLGQWWALLRRCLAIKVQDRWNTGILLAQAPIIALLICVGLGTQLRAGPADPAAEFERHQLYPGNVASSIFLLALAGLWFGCSNAVREIVGEWSIYRRERMVNLSIPAYVASKAVVLGGLGVVQCAVLLGIVHVGCKLQGPWLPTYFLLLLGAFTGTVLGLLISAVAKTSEMAIALVPVVLLPLVLFGGVLVRIHDVGVVGKTIAAVAPTRWAFEGLFVLESDARGRCINRQPPPPGVPAPEPPKKVDVAEGLFPQEHQKSEKNHRYRPWVCALVLTGTIVLLTGSILVVLRRRDIH
jgi:hypothetical protein